MCEEVVRWLAEIRALRQELEQAQRECDRAHESAANWRNLYSTEAKQRRTEVRLAQQQLERLKAEMKQLQCRGIRPQLDTPEAVAAIEAQVSQLQTIEELRVKLAEVIKERDRALEALNVEQENHSQTRKSLTTVIGDTVNQLVKVRGKGASGAEKKME